MKTYELKDKNVTAVIDNPTMNQWRKSLKITGLTNAQAFPIALALFFSEPAAWIEVEDTEDRPSQANFHVRLKGITGTWLEELVHAFTVKRLAQNNTYKVSQTDVIRAVLAHFNNLATTGRLMSL